MPGSETESKSGSKAGSKSGSKAGSKSGSKAGSKSGSRPTSPQSSPKPASNAALPSVFRIKALKLTKPASDPPPEKYETSPVTNFEYECATLDEFKNTTLDKVRSKIGLVMSESFRFSDKNGSVVEDTINFDSYLRDLETPITPENSSSWIEIYVIPFKKGATAVTDVLNNPPFMLKFVQKLDGDEVRKEGTLHSSTLPALKGGELALSRIRKYVGAMSSTFRRHQFCLEDGHVVDDSMTLKDYLASSSKPVDQADQTPSIEVYFRKPGGSKTKKKGASDWVKDHDALKPDKEMQGDEALKIERDKALLELKEKLDAASYKMDSAAVAEAKSAGKLTEDEWQLVIRNCNLMFGWVVDVDTHTVTRAAKPAFQLKKGLNMGVGADTNTAPAADEEKSIQLPEKSHAIPNFAVTDDARIEISMVEHQFQESMAKAHFSSTSVEASVSGGFGAFSAGVSASYSNSSQSEEKKSRKENEKTLVGTYLFPRATVYLTPGDLEPTAELKSAIARIRAKQDITDLRRLHKDFGHLFCQSVVVGGCLQTTKIVTMTEETEETSQKDQFKVSPWVSGSVKASHEQGSAQQQGQTTAENKEKLVFEATGGNTLLATNPEAWTASLVDHGHWRVIKQDKLSSLAEALSQTEGYAEVLMWFSQAVPALSRYVQIPPARRLNFRLKAVADGLGIQRVLGEGIHKYLGHNPERIPELVHIGVEPLPKALGTEFGSGLVEKGWPVVDMTAFTIPRSLRSATPLFSPKRTQAPVLIPYTGKISVGKPGEDDKSKADFKAFKDVYKLSVWKFEVPNGDVLVHGSRVSITSLASEPNPTLSVYRNEQGVFMPAMTSQDGPSYWRVLRSDPTAREDDPIRDGDTIRLSWRFSDQTAGFRDFYDDTFGRRRFSKPDKASDDLYLKIPYPPFQASEEIAMTLSAAETTKPVLQTLKVIPSPGVSYIGPQACYNLHDVSFRLDFMGPDGLGESRDYMAPVGSEESANTGVTWVADKTQLKLPALMIANLLLPGARGPTVGPLLHALLL
ncbi:unnamed protein product [Rhizoctonia solani]|uniref:MACPF-like domain-containing protein n=1 Tax=Rhizoctonia solani TaxID=456999 RepID=A0A8H3AYJ2_9AGAM|nr:unnamed protein product [Rhizoctonia solani]